MLVYWRIDLVWSARKQLEKSRFVHGCHIKKLCICM
uniref:Uncharacterized protein n=1 Tax=Schistosoma japonicum TaxID=6182 RepID=Q5C6T4_SCHJA|nr:unknown [Schistosoma japonicum]AAX24877.1 unknown [Schistosoma japonicum]